MPTLGEALRSVIRLCAAPASQEDPKAELRQRRRGSAEPMAALGLVGTTSERDANPTRGGADRATGRAQPGSVKTSGGEDRYWEHPAFIFAFSAARREPPGE